MVVVAFLEADYICTSIGLCAERPKNISLQRETDFQESVDCLRSRDKLEGPLVAG